MTDQIQHIQNNTQHLKARAMILHSIRQWFFENNFTEITAPTALRYPGQEPHLSPIPVAFHNDRGECAQLYLHTSPEYTMKKALSAGLDKIYSLGSVFRDYESFGGLHNPEFTMLEWYRRDADMFDIMDDLDSLMSEIQAALVKLEIGTKASVSPENKKLSGSIERISMKQLWEQTIHVNLDNYLTREAMYALCHERGYSVPKHEPYEDLFYRIFLNEIESKICIPNSAFCIYNYPAQMAALAKLSDEDPRYAERFELYINGIEIANAFSELTDPTEQRRRFHEEQKQRRQLGKPVYPIDEGLLYALEHIDRAAGVALGVDRLVQVLLGRDNIDDVLVLPMSEMHHNTEESTLNDA